MKRLLILPAVAAGAAIGAGLWLSGLAWPVVTQTWSIIAPRPDTAETEDDMIG